MGGTSEVIKCPICRADFVSKRSWQKFCHPKCKNTAKRRRQRGTMGMVDRARGRKVEAWEVAPQSGSCPFCRARAFIVGGKFNCCGRPYAVN